MAQINFDWIVGAFGAFETGPAEILNPFLDDQTIAIFQLVDDFDRQLKGDSLRVERVVGQVWMRRRSSQPAAGQLQEWIVRERIYTTELGEDGLQPGLVHDLFNVNDMDRPFMWERTSAMSTWRGNMQDLGRNLLVNDLGQVIGLNDVPVAVDKRWSEIDCQVARRLHDREVLVYQVQVATTSDEAFFQGEQLDITPYLRVGVKT